MTARYPLTAQRLTIHLVVELKLTGRNDEEWGNPIAEWNQGTTRRTGITAHEDFRWRLFI